MAKFLWALCCENAIVNNKTNNLSLIEILEQFNVTSFPAVIAQQIYLVSLWEKSEKDKKETFYFKIDISQSDSPDGTGKTAEVEADIPQEKNRLRNVCRIFGLKVDKDAPVYFIISQKFGDRWEEVHRIPLLIKLKS